jgi:hypothetical protein
MLHCAEVYKQLASPVRRIVSHVQTISIHVFMNEDNVASQSFLLWPRKTRTKSSPIAAPTRLDTESKNNYVDDANGLRSPNQVKYWQDAAAATAATAAMTMNGKS